MRTHRKASNVFVMFLAVMILCGISNAVVAEEAPSRGLRLESAQAGAPRLEFRLGATEFMLGDNAVGNTMTKALCTQIGPYCDSQGNCGWTSENMCCVWECWFAN